jgi:hypothetical protein
MRSGPLGHVRFMGQFFWENEESREKLTWDTYQEAIKCHERQSQ